MRGGAGSREIENASEEMSGLKILHPDALHEGDKEVEKAGDGMLFANALWNGDKGDRESR